MKNRIIGCGNAWRKDDGVGLEVARRLKALALARAEVQEASGEAADIIERMKGAEGVVLIDAMQSGRPAGTLRRFEPQHGNFEAGSFSSSHDFGIPQALALAEALEIRPRGLIVYGIEGADFSMGRGLSPEVEAAAERLVGILSQVHA